MDFDIKKGLRGSTEVRGVVRIEGRDAQRQRLAGDDGVGLRTAPCKDGPHMRVAIEDAGDAVRLEGVVEGLHVRVVPLVLEDDVVRHGQGIAGKVDVVRNDHRRAGCADVLGEVLDEELEAVHRVVAPLAGDGLHPTDGDSEVDEVHAVHDPCVVEAIR